MLAKEVEVLLGKAEAALTSELAPATSSSGAAAALAAGDYVTYTPATGEPQPTRIRRVVVAGEGTQQRFEVAFGFEGATRLANAAQLKPRRSEPRLEDLRHLRELAGRSTGRLRHYYAHEVRAAHEAHVMCRLLDELGDDEVVLVADWKMKFLMSCFREAMSDFFGKRGMPWHGCMLVRKPRASEAQYGAGEFVCEYKDAMMLGSKEDGYATLCAVHLALKEYKAANPFISSCYVKTDGAAAYSGSTFTLGLSFMGEMVGVRVVRHLIGEAGKNKSQLDGHFAVAGEALRRLICSGLHDVRTPTDLFRGLEKVLARGTTASLFEVRRTSEFAMATVQSLTLMADREFQYDADGEFSVLVLRRQSWLGEGLHMGVRELFPEGRKAPEPARVVQVRSLGGVTPHPPDAHGGMPPPLQVSAASAMPSRARTRGGGSRRRRRPRASTRKRGGARRGRLPSRPSCAPGGRRRRAGGAVTTRADAQAATACT